MWFVSKRRAAVLTRYATLLEVVYVDCIQCKRRSTVLTRYPPLLEVVYVDCIQAELRRSYTISNLIWKELCVVYESKAQRPRYYNKTNFKRIRCIELNEISVLSFSY